MESIFSIPEKNQLLTQFHAKSSKFRFSNLTNINIFFTIIKLSIIDGILHVAIIYIDVRTRDFSHKSKMVTRDPLGGLVWNDSVIIVTEAWTTVKSASCVKNVFKQWMFLRWQQAARHTDVTPRFFSDPLGVIEDAPICNAGIFRDLTQCGDAKYKIFVLFNYYHLVLEDFQSNIGNTMF